jgi:FMN phosphatase YigB (HAD superfamily)
MDFSQIRAVLFDLDGTLYRQTKLRRLMALELLRLPLESGLKAPRYFKAIGAYRRAQEGLRSGQTADPAGAQIAAAAEASGLPIAEVEALISEWFQRRPLRHLRFCLPAGLDRWLSWIRHRGLRLGVLSDYPARDKIAALGLDGMFDPVLCSTDPEIGAFKPSPRGYLRACEVWGLPPAEVLFVGDRIDVDAAGAAAAGMPCVIIGRDWPVSDPERCIVLPSFERLCRVADHR